MIGKSLSQYEIIELIGEGGMGQVYRARDTKLGRDVAIKVLPTEFAANAERLARFEQEARTVGSLNHPGLVTLYELGQFEGSPYMVMELVEGETLRAKLGGDDEATTSPASGTGLPVRRAVELAIQIAQGLGAAHGQGIVHRDIKPENILVTTDGRAKILDFGLAKLSDPPTDESEMASTQAMKTEPGKVMGTVGYMSPEQVRGAETDHRTDIFSLGLLVYEMISGQRAFQADTSVETMSAILNQDPPALTAASGPHLSPAIERVIRRCLEKEAAHRFQSANDLAYALDAMQDATSAAQPILDDAKTSRRGGPAMLLVAALAVAAVAFFAGRMGGGGTEVPDTAVRSPRLIPLTFEKSVKARPGMSPDSRSFVYTEVVDGQQDIVLRRVGGETRVNLTNTPGDDEMHPAYSPDGEQIVFCRAADRGGLFVMGATGESARRLTDFGFNPAWSPDGTKVVFCTERIDDPRGRTTLSALWTVDVKTGGTEKIFDGDAVEPAWSPDGSRIAFWALPPGSGDRILYTIPAEGGQPVYVTGDNTFSWNPVWTDGGASLVFASNRGGRMDLWKIAIGSDGGAAGPAIPVTSSTEWLAEPDVSAAGDKILCVARRLRHGLTRISVESGQREVIQETSRALSMFSVAPDGSSMAIAASDPYEDIYVFDLAGEEFRRLTRDSYKDRQPFFTPDSREIYFYSDRSGRYEVWRIRPDGSGLTQITALEGDNVSQPRMSPDGERLAVSSTDRGCGFIDLTGGLPVTEVDWIEPPSPGNFFLAAGWSPDGKELLGRDYERSAWRYSIADREYTPIRAVQDRTSWVDETHLLEIRNGEFITEDPRTGEFTPLDIEVPTGTRFFHLSPDGEWIYTMEGHPDSDIWMLDFSGEE